MVSRVLFTLESPLLYQLHAEKKRENDTHNIEIYDNQKKVLREKIYFALIFDVSLAKFQQKKPPT